MKNINVGKTDNTSCEVIMTTEKVSYLSDILLPGLCSCLSSCPLTGAVVHGVEESLAVPGPVPGHAGPGEGRVQVEVVGLDKNI